MSSDHSLFPTKLTTHVPSPASRHSHGHASRVSSLTPKSRSTLFLAITNTHRITNPRQAHQSLTPSHPLLRTTSAAKAHSSIAFGISTAMSRDPSRFLLAPLRDTPFPPLPWEERLYRQLNLASHSSDLSLPTVNEPTPQLRFSKNRHYHHRPLLRGNSSNNIYRRKRRSFSLSSLASTSPGASPGATCRICGIVGRAPTPCPWLHFGSRLCWRRLASSIARPGILECFGL
jgi:hypothetical protein